MDFNLELDLDKGALYPKHRVSQQPQGDSTTTEEITTSGRRRVKTRGFSPDTEPFYKRKSRSSKTEDDKDKDSADESVDMNAMPQLEPVVPAASSSTRRSRAGASPPEFSRPTQPVSGTRSRVRVSRRFSPTPEASTRKKKDLLPVLQMEMNTPDQSPQHSPQPASLVGNILSGYASLSMISMAITSNLKKQTAFYIPKSMIEEVRERRRQRGEDPYPVLTYCGGKEFTRDSYLEQFAADGLKKKVNTEDEVETQPQTSRRKSVVPTKMNVVGTLTVAVPDPLPLPPTHSLQDITEVPVEKQKISPVAVAGLQLMSGVSVEEKKARVSAALSHLTHKSRSKTPVRDTKHQEKSEPRVLSPAPLHLVDVKEESLRSSKRMSGGKERVSANISPLTSSAKEDRALEQAIHDIGTSITANSPDSSIVLDKRARGRPLGVKRSPFGGDTPGEGEASRRRTSRVSQPTSKIFSADISLPSFTGEKRGKETREKKKEEPDEASGSALTIFKRILHTRVSRSSVGCRSPSPPSIGGSTSTRETEKDENKTEGKDAEKNQSKEPGSLADQIVEKEKSPAAVNEERDEEAEEASFGDEEPSSTLRIVEDEELEELTSDKKDYENDVTMEEDEDDVFIVPPPVPVSVPVADCESTPTSARTRARSEKRTPSLPPLSTAPKRTDPTFVLGEAATSRSSRRSISKPTRYADYETPDDVRIQTKEQANAPVAILVSDRSTRSREDPARPRIALRIRIPRPDTAEEKEGGGEDKEADIENEERTPKKSTSPKKDATPKKAKEDVIKEKEVKRELMSHSSSPATIYNFGSETPTGGDETLSLFSPNSMLDESMEMDILEGEEEEEREDLDKTLTGEHNLDIDEERKEKQREARRERDRAKRAADRARRASFIPSQKPSLGYVVYDNGTRENLGRTINYLMDGILLSVCNDGIKRHSSLVPQSEKRRRMIEHAKAIYRGKRAEIDAGRLSPSALNPLRKMRRVVESDMQIGKRRRQAPTSLYPGEEIVIPTNIFGPTEEEKAAERERIAAASAAAEAADNPPPAKRSRRDTRRVSEVVTVDVLQPQEDMDDLFSLIQPTLVVPKIEVEQLTPYATPAHEPMDEMTFDSPKSFITIHPLPPPPKKEKIPMTLADYIAMHPTSKYSEFSLMGEMPLHVVDETRIGEQEFWYKEMVVRRPSLVDYESDNELDVDGWDADDTGGENETCSMNKARRAAKEITDILPRPRISIGVGDEGDEEWTMEDMKERTIAFNPLRKELSQALLRIVCNQRAAVITSEGLCEGASVLHSTTQRNAQMLRDQYKLFSNERMDSVFWLHNWLLRLLPEDFLADYLQLLRYAKTLSASHINAVLRSVDTRKPEWEEIDRAIADCVHHKVHDPHVDGLAATLLTRRLPDVTFILVSPHATGSGYHPKPKYHEYMYKCLRELGGSTSEVLKLQLDDELSDITVAEAADQMVNTVLAKVRSTVKHSRQSRRVVLVGWGTSCYVNHRVCQLTHGIATIINFAFPLVTGDGFRGQSVDDDILLTYCPTLFVVGAEAIDIEPMGLRQLRTNMTADTGAIVVGEANHNLCISTTRLAQIRTTQRMATRCVAEAVCDFLQQDRVLLNRAVLQPPELNNVFTVHGELCKEAGTIKKKKEDEMVRKNEPPPKKLPLSTPLSLSLPSPGHISLSGARNVFDSVLHRGSLVTTSPGSQVQRTMPISGSVPFKEPRAPLLTGFRHGMPVLQSQSPHLATQPLPPSQTSPLTYAQLLPVTSHLPPSTTAPIPPTKPAPPVPYPQTSPLPYPQSAPLPYSQFHLQRSQQMSSPSLPPQLPKQTGPLDPASISLG